MEPVTAPDTMQTWNAFIPHPEDFIRLAAGRDFQLGFAPQRRHFYFRAKRGLGKAYECLNVDIVAVALENRVLVHIDEYVEVAA